MARVTVSKEELHLLCLMLAQSYLKDSKVKDISIESLREMASGIADQFSVPQDIAEKTLIKVAVAILGEKKKQLLGLLSEDDIEQE